MKESRNRVGRPAKLSREKILQAAMELGSQASSFGTVAAQLDVSPQSLYSYFPNMDALRLAVAARNLEHLSPSGLAPGKLDQYLLDMVIEFRRWTSSIGIDPAVFNMSTPEGFSIEPSAERAYKQHLEEFLTATAGEGIDPVTAMTLFVILTDFVTSTSTIRLADGWWTQFDDALGDVDALKNSGLSHIAAYRERRESDPSKDEDPFLIAARCLIRGILIELNVPSHSELSSSNGEVSHLEGANSTGGRRPSGGSRLVMGDTAPTHRRRTNSGPSDNN